MKIFNKIIHLFSYMSLICVSLALLKISVKNAYEKADRDHLTARTVTCYQEVLLNRLSEL